MKLPDHMVCKKWDAKSEETVQLVLSNAAVKQAFETLLRRNGWGVFPIPFDPVNDLPCYGIMLLDAAGEGK